MGAAAAVALVALGWAINHFVGIHYPVWSPIRHSSGMQTSNVERRTSNAYWPNAGASRKKFAGKLLVTVAPMIGALLDSVTQLVEDTFVTPCNW